MVIDLLEQILPSIKNSIYPVKKELLDWKMKQGNIREGAAVKLNVSSWTPIRIPFQWGTPNKIFWFRNTITITEELAGKPLVLLLDFADAILFINGKPHQSIDKNHKEAIITEKARLNEQYVVAVQAYSGNQTELNNFSFAEIAVLDPIARRLSSGLSALYELEKILEHGSDEIKEVRELIRRTLIFLKYFRPGSEEYPNAIRRAYTFLTNAITDEFKTSFPGFIHLLAYSRLKNHFFEISQDAKRNCIKLFTTILRLIEEFPEFKFVQNQTLLYEFIQSNYPEIFKQIKKQITDGKWEALCTTYAEPDLNIPNGESIIRQIIYGKRFLKKELGIESNIFWLPETFGFNASLPQILAKSGISYFFTTALLLNDTTKFPYTSFWWEGIDGTRILAHIPPIGLDTQINSKHLLKAAESIPADPPALPFIQTYGHSDNGGGPTKQDIEYSACLKSVIGLPNSQLSSAQEFFRHLLDFSELLPVWNNELYLEAHRGTYTTHGWIKKENRECEKNLYTAELLGVIAMLFGKKASYRKYPKENLNTAWKKILFNQNYNIIGGTCSSNIYEKIHPYFAQIKKICSDEIKRSVEGLSNQTKKSNKEFFFSVFNPLGWQRSEYIEIFVKTKEKKLVVWELVSEAKGKSNNKKKNKAKEPSIKSVEFQVIERTSDGLRILCFIENIPPLGFKNIVVKTTDSKMETPQLWRSTSQGIETPFYKVRFDRKGELSTIYSKTLRKDILQKGKRGNQFLTFHESTKEWEAWDIHYDYKKNPIEILHFRHAKIIETGPLRASIHIAFRTNNNSVISQTVYLYHRSPRIDFCTNLRWQEKRTLMKVAFALNLKATEATYEIPLGALVRTTKPRNDEEKAKYEVPAQQWADISDNKFGVSLLNDSKYAYDAHENILRLTLIRSPHYPDPTEPVYPDHPLTDQGEHIINYALYPHAGDWRSGDTMLKAREFNNPVLVFPNITANELPAIITSSKNNVLIDVIKKAEDSDDIIVRLHETHGNETSSTLNLNFKALDAYECDLLENEQKQLSISKSKIALKFKPFEIKTVKLLLKRSKK